MELVATSKLKRATDRVRAARPYADALHEIVAGLYSPGLSEKYPILRRPDVVKRAAVLLLTANRGLCGGFNSNLIKQARKLMEELRGQGIETELHIAGKKGDSVLNLSRQTGPGENKSSALPERFAMSG